jgi:hypothetical protein
LIKLALTASNHSELSIFKIIHSCLIIEAGMISQNTFFFTANTFHGSDAAGILLSALNSTRSMSNSSKQIAAIKFALFKPVPLNSAPYQVY